MSMSFLNRDFSATNANNSGALKKLSKGVVQKLSNSQRQVLYKAMGKYKNSSNTLGKALGDLELGKNDGISPDVVNSIKKETGVKIDRSGYYSSRKNNVSVSSQQRTPYVSAQKTSMPSQANSQVHHTNTSAGLMQKFSGMNYQLGGGGLIKPNR